MAITSAVPSSTAMIEGSTCNKIETGGADEMGTSTVDDTFPRSVSATAVTKAIPDCVLVKVASTCPDASVTRSPTPSVPSIHPNVVENVTDTPSTGLRLLSSNRARSVADSSAENSEGSADTKSR